LGERARYLGQGALLPSTRAHAARRVQQLAERRELHQAPP